MNTSDPRFDRPDDHDADRHDPDLATRFATAVRPASIGAVESDLDAVHRRARHVQRRRVIGGTAAAGLLVLGGGFIVIADRDDEPTIAVQAQPGADADDTTDTSVVPDDTDDATDPAPDPDPDPQPDAGDGDGDGDDGTAGEPKTSDPAFDLSELDGMFGDFPIPELPAFPEPGADGTTDWSAYVEELGRSLEAWVGDLQAWLADNPDVTTWFDLNGPFGDIGGPLGELDIDQWLQDFDVEDWQAELDQLDLDQWLQDFDVDQWHGEFDAGAFDLDGWLDGLDIDRWRDQLESGEIDIDQWLTDLGALGGEAGPFPFPDLENLPDLGELENLDLENLPDLGEFGPFDLENLDLENLDLDQLFQDVAGGDGQLPDLSELQSQFEELFGDLQGDLQTD